MDNDELAYDLDKLDEIYYAQQNIKKANTQEKKAEVRNLNRKKYLRFLLVALYVFALICILAFANAKRTEVSSTLLDRQDELAQQENQNTTLNLNLESMVTLKNVEQIAKHELGMIEPSVNQIQYIVLNNANKAEVLEENENLFSKIISIYEKAKEYIL